MFLFRGIFWSGPPFAILKAWKQRKIDIIVSREILGEYDRVSKELSKKFPSVDLSPFIELLTIHAEMHVAKKLDEPVSRDPDDDKFIACALAARVKIIVSGDQDLLLVSGYHDIRVIKPNIFVQEYLS
jgi:uncharacterized protein